MSVKFRLESPGKSGFSTAAERQSEASRFSVTITPLCNDIFERMTRAMHGYDLYTNGIVTPSINLYNTCMSCTHKYFHSTIIYFLCTVSAGFASGELAILYEALRIRVSTWMDD